MTAVSVLLVDLRGHRREHGQIVPLVKSRSEFETADAQEEIVSFMEDTRMLSQRWVARPVYLLIAMSGIPVIR